MLAGLDVLQKHGSGSDSRISVTMQGVLIDKYGVAFAVNATAFTPTVTQSDISSKACYPLTLQV